MKRSVSVEVAGQKLNLKTDADEEYVKALARLVNQKIGEAKSGGRAVATQSLAILAAMSIADDLLQARHKDAEFRREVKSRSHRLLELLDTLAR